MAWIGPDDSYIFTINVMLEGRLEIWSLQVQAEGKTWTLITNGVEASPPPAIQIHPGQTIKMPCTVKNIGLVADNFIVRRTRDAIIEETPSFPLAVNAVQNITFPDFNMPSANVSIKIETFHEE